MNIILPDPPELYDRSIWAEMNNELRQAFFRAFGTDDLCEVGDGELVLTSADGTRYAVRVDDDGNLGTVSLGKSGVLESVAYGGIYVTSGVGSQTIGTAWTKVNQFTSAGPESRATTPDPANDRVDVEIRAVYDAYFSVVFTGSNNTQYRFGISSDDTAGGIAPITTVAKTGSNDFATADLLVRARLEETESLSLWVQADGANKSFDVEEATLNLKMIAQLAEL